MVKWCVIQSGIYCSMHKRIFFSDKDISINVTSLGRRGCCHVPASPNFFKVMMLRGQRKSPHLRNALAFLFFALIFLSLHFVHGARPTSRPAIFYALSGGVPPPWCAPFFWMDSFFDEFGLRN